MNKGTKGSPFPRNPSAELREMLLEQSKEPVGDSATTSPPPPEVDNSTLYSEHDSNIARAQESKLGSKLSSTLSSDRARKQDSKVAKEQASVEAILLDLQDQPLSQLNVRVPQGINDWLDEEAHRHRKKGVTKQSLVTRAVAMLIAAQQQAGEKGSD